MINEKQGQDYV